MRLDDLLYNFCGNVGVIPHNNSIVERICNLAMEFSAAGSIGPITEQRQCEAR
jgi:hypothetical protein